MEQNLSPIWMQEYFLLRGLEFDSLLKVTAGLNFVIHASVSVCLVKILSSEGAVSQCNSLQLRIAVYPDMSQCRYVNHQVFSHRVFLQEKRPTSSVAVRMRNRILLGQGQLVAWTCAEYNVYTLHLILQRYWRQLRQLLHCKSDKITATIYNAVT